MTAPQIADSTITTQSGDVFFEGGDLYNLTVTSAGLINGSDVKGNIVGGSYVGTDNITFENAALISKASFDGSADVILGASGNIELVQVKANDGATLTSDAAIDGATVIANNNDVILDALHIASSTVTAENGAPPYPRDGGAIVYTVFGDRRRDLRAGTSTTLQSSGGAISGRACTGNIVQGRYLLPATSLR